MYVIEHEFVMENSVDITIHNLIKMTAAPLKLVIRNDKQEYNNDKEWKMRESQTCYHCVNDSKQCFQNLRYVITWLYAINKNNDVNNTYPIY